jgi:hypothetical protein
MQPSDSLVCVGLVYGCPLHFGLPRGGGFFCAEPPEGGVGRPRVPPRTRGASGSGHRVPVAPVMARRTDVGLPGFWVVPFTLAAVEHPARPAAPRQLGRGSAAAGNLEARGARNQSIFEAASPRPSCSRAYASPPPSREAAQGSLPACWLGFGRTGFAPAGRRTGFREATASHLLPDQPCLVAPCAPCALAVHLSPAASDSGPVFEDRAPLVQPRVSPSPLCWPGSWCSGRGRACPSSARS